MRITPKQKSEYPYFEEIATRWRDNDVYGHMNNVVFYEFSDSVVNHWLSTKASLKVPNSPVLGLVVETKCTYFSELQFPKPVNCGLKVNKIGNTSVSYEIGLFSGLDEMTAARISFVHVYVDAKSRRPVSLPQSLIDALETIKAVV